MILISLSCDNRKRSIRFKWNGFLSLGWEKGKFSPKILKLPIPLSFRQRKIHIPLRWVYLKGAFSFLTEWKLKKVEGTFSFPDPMINGVIYGWWNAIETGRVSRKINVTVNFLGENGCRGEFIISLKILFHHLKRWILPLLWEARGRRPKKGGE